MKPHGTSPGELSRVPDQSGTPGVVSPETPTVSHGVRRGRCAASVAVSPITDTSATDDLHRPVTKVGERPKSSPPTTRVTLGGSQKPDTSPRAGDTQRHKFSQTRRANSRDLRMQASGAIKRRTIQLPQTEPPLGSPMRIRYFAKLLDLDSNTLDSPADGSRSPQLHPRRQPVTNLRSVPNTPSKIPLAPGRNPARHSRSTSVPNAKTPLPIEQMVLKISPPNSPHGGSRRAAELLRSDRATPKQRQERSASRSKTEAPSPVSSPGRSKSPTMPDLDTQQGNIERIVDQWKSLHTATSPASPQGGEPTSDH